MIVRKLRLQRGWTQEQLAALADLSVRSIQRIESGQTYSLETRNSLAAVFEIERSMLHCAAATVTNEASLTTEEIAAVEYVKGLKDFFSHAALYVFYVVVVGFVFGFEHPLMLWGSIGWAAGVFGHGLAAYGVIDIFSPGWEKKQIEKRLGRQLPGQLSEPAKLPFEGRIAIIGYQVLIQIRRVAMKIFARVSGSVAVIAGMALLAWVTYDATNVMQLLGLQSRMDEATVAVATLSLGAFLLVLGIYSWRQTRESAAARSA